MRVLRLVLLAFVALSLTLPVQAGLIISTGNNPQPDEENVLFNDVGLIGLGNPVTGMTNQTHLLVEFLGDEDLETPSGGQALVQAVDGTLRHFIVSLPGATFADYIFNLHVLDLPGTAPQGTVSITANGLVGGSLTGNFSIGVGSNFFTVLAFGGGERLTSVEVTTNVDLEDVRQNRISGAEPIPEPGSAFLLLGGIAALAWYRRRRTA